MTVIIDANIIISAVIKLESQITQILLTLNNKIDFVLPEYALVEIRKHQKRICYGNGIPTESFTEMVDKILSGVLVFSSNTLTDDILRKAEKIASSVDANDALYVAFSLSLNALFWTGDLKLQRGLRRKGFNNIVTTKEFKEIIKGL